MAKGIAYINNKFVPIGKAALSIMDLTVQRGYGISEVLRTYNRRPFMLGEHMRRLRNSARMMRMKNCPPERQIRKAISAGLGKIRGELLIKILVTGGPGAHITPVGRPGLIVYFLPFVGHPRSDYERGFRMMTTKLRRTMPAAKSVDYFPAILAEIDAKAGGFDEAVFTDRDRVLEGTTFNIALIRGRTLVAPKNDVLEGMTMDLVLRLARRAGLRTVRRDIKFADLKRADEMFSTSTIRDILPIVGVDKIRIGAGKPGKYAKMLLEEFRQYAKKTKIS